MPLAAMKKITKKTAQQLVAEYGTPIDFERLLKDEEIALKREVMEESVSGMLVIKNADTTIVVNSSHHHTRQRFTIAHEFGHYFLHANANGSAFFDQSEKVFMRDAISACGTQKEEIQANKFAAELLMPKDYLLKKFDSKKIDLYDDYQLRLLASELKVSLQALVVRLTALDLIPNDCY